MNPFYNVREQRPRAFWRLLFQLAIYAAAVAFSRLVAPSIWVALYRKLVDSETIVRPTSPTSLFVAVQVALVLIALCSLRFSARLFDSRPLSHLGLRVDREWWLDLGFGLVLGGLLMSAIFLIELAAGWVTFRGALETTREGAPFFPIILAPMVGWVCLGLHEELVLAHPLCNRGRAVSRSCIYIRAYYILCKHHISIRAMEGVRSGAERFSCRILDMSFREDPFSAFR